MRKELQAPQPERLPRQHDLVAGAVITPVPLGTKPTDAAREEGAPAIGVSPATGRAPPGPGERPVQ